MTVSRYIFLSVASALAALPSFAASKSGGLFGWLLDPTTNVAFLAMAVFLAIVWRVGGFRIIVRMLDDQRRKIADELRTAHDLKNEAVELYSKAESEHQNAVKEGDRIVEDAKKQAKQIKKDMEESLEVAIKRKQTLAETRIRRVEAEAVATIQKAVADTATAAVAQLISQQDGTKLFEQAADQIDKTSE